MPDPTELLLTGAAALVLAAVQLLPRILAKLHGEGRRWTVSTAGGFSVAFVFVYLLPELAEAQREVDARGAYIRAGWWLLAVAVVVGWGVGALVTMPPGVVGS